MSDQIAAFLAKNGPLSELFGSQFEVRPQQRDMSFAVWKALESKSHLVVEAGTGVGKSYAYLIPAIIHALEKKNVWLYRRTR